MSNTAILPHRVIWPARSYNSSTSLSMDNTNTKVGFRLLYPEALTITGLEFRGTRSGSPGTYSVGLQTESAGFPSGTYLTNGEVTPVTPVAAGWITKLNFPGNVSLSALTPYWLIMEQVGVYSSANKYGMFYMSDGSGNTPPAFCSAAFIAGAWGTPSIGRMPSAVWTLSDTSLYGNPYWNTGSRNTGGSARVGLRMGFDVPTVLKGFFIYMFPSATSGLDAIEAKLFDTSNVQQGPTITQTLSNVWGPLTPSTTVAAVVPLWFGADVSVPAGGYYLSLRNASASASPTWDVFTMQSDYGGASSAAEGVGRGGTTFGVYARADDTSAWALGTAGTFEDGAYGPIFSSQSSGSGGGGVSKGRLFGGL